MEKKLTPHDLQSVRIFRVVEYSGPRHTVENTIAKSIHGTRRLSSRLTIRAATIPEYPRVLQDLLTGILLHEDDNSDNNQK